MTEIQDIAAELGDGWIPEGLPSGQFSAGVQHIREKAKAFDRKPDEISMAWSAGDLHNFIDEKRSSVVIAAGSLLAAPNATIESLPWRIGTPDQCKKKVESYVEAGATNIVVGYPDFPSARSLEMFTKEVLPSFR